MAGGYVGLLARVDLTTRRVTLQPTTEYSERFVGGVGIAAKIYFDEAPRGVDPFADENPLIFMTGPLTGTPAPSSGFTLLYSKSPMGYPDTACRPSAMGGALGPELKYAGFDGIVITGRADVPAYLWISDGVVEVRDAADLWGLDTYETQTALRRTHGQRVRVATIGPAGEHLTRMAAIVHETGHASGLSGFGAVMGSKNLKALAVRGSGGVPVARPDELMELSRRAVRLIYDPDDPPRLSGMKGLHAIPGQKDFIAEHGKGASACQACPIACLPIIEAPGVPLSADSCGWPHVVNEAGALAGIALDAQGWRTNWELNVTAERLGMSTWESKWLFGFLMRLRDAGVITEESSGLRLHGDPRLLWLDLLRKVAYREGIGDLLAEQLPRAAEALGHDSKSLFVQSRGWPIAMEWDDPRTHPMMTMLPSTGTYLCYAEPWFLFAVLAGEYHLSLSDQRELLGEEEIGALSKRIYGDRLLVDPTTFEGKAELTVASHNTRMLVDALLTCRFAMHYDIDYYAEDMVGEPEMAARLFSAVTGKDVDQGWLMNLGERLVNLDRIQGVRHGYASRSHDVAAIDGRAFSEPLLELSPLPGQIVDRDSWLLELDRYYALRGWDRTTGVPQTDTLERLELREEAAALEARDAAG
jgi:aldehyde:ferredoxin oxidoreductase